jgi:hypothetical protein
VVAGLTRTMELVLRSRKSTKPTCGLHERTSFIPVWTAHRFHSSSYLLSFIPFSSLSFPSTTSSTLLYLCPQLLLLSSLLSVLVHLTHYFQSSRTYTAYNTAYTTIEEVSVVLTKVKLGSHDPYERLYVVAHFFTHSDTNKYVLN